MLLEDLTQVTIASGDLLYLVREVTVGVFEGKSCDYDSIIIGLATETWTTANFAVIAHAHAGADITTGTVDIARLPTGTTGTTVSLGNHTHNASAITAGTVAIARLPTGATGAHVCIGDDARLSDDRFPLAHGHDISDITGFDPNDKANIAGGNTFTGTQVISTLDVTTINHANFDADATGVGFYGTAGQTQPVVADTTDTSDAAIQLNALLAALRTLGLIS